MRIPLFLVLACVLLFTACGESHNALSPEAFNKKLQSRTDLHSPEVVAKFWMEHLWGAVPQRGFSIEIDSSHTPEYHIMLVADSLHDDSVMGKKFLLTAHKSEGMWQLSEIEHNWKCWPGRGHSGWGIVPCN